VDRLCWGWARGPTPHRDSVTGAPDRTAFDRAMRRMVRELADDHSAWDGLAEGQGAVASDPEETVRLPDAPPRIGVQLGFVAGRGLVVERVYPGSAAERAGLQRGDVIVAADDASLRPWRTLVEAQRVLALALDDGLARLSVERRRSSLALDVHVPEVAPERAAATPYGVLLDASTAYLAVPSFNAPGIGASVHATLRDLAAAGAVNLVLDLRGNLGGRLVELGLVLGAFVDGDWAEAVARGDVAWRGRYERDASIGRALLLNVAGQVMSEAFVEGPIRWPGKVVAIVSAENSSAGEIAALALQDLGRARVVGEATTGNVEAIRGFGLPDGSRVMVAVANLRGTRGLDFDAGVVPDVTVRTTLEDLARGYDPAVAEARRLLGGLPFTPDRHF
jgi:carboxyl-terminal processing protease